MIRGIQYFREENEFAIESVGKQRVRSVKITLASCMGHLFIGTVKLITGILSLSFFTCASGLYTLGMVLAKWCAIRGIIKETDRQKQYYHYKLSGIILIIASITYVAYSARLLVHPSTSRYHIYVGIGIATFTFVEIGMNIYGIIKERHNDMPLFHAIKMINLASSLICLVLTQNAILSFADAGIINNNIDRKDQFMGILMGVAATIIGFIMLYRINKIKQKEEMGEE